MPPVARIGDTGSHGGSIITGHDRRTANGIPVACVGDIYACPIHGPNPIIEGSSIASVDGAQLARFGDATECGATINSGSPTDVDDG